MLPCYSTVCFLAFATPSFSGIDCLLAPFHTTLFIQWQDCLLLICPSPQPKCAVCMQVIPLKAPVSLTFSVYVHTYIDINVCVCVCDLYIVYFSLKKCPVNLRLCCFFSCDFKNLLRYSQWFEIELAYLLLGHDMQEAFNQAIPILRAFELLDEKWGKLNFKLHLVHQLLASLLCTLQLFLIDQEPHKLTVVASFYMISNRCSIKSESIQSRVHVLIAYF